MFIRHPPPLTGNRPSAFTKRTTHAPHRGAARFRRGPAQRAQRKLLSGAVSGPCSAIFFASRLASVLISGGGGRERGGGGLYASVRRRKAQGASLNERAGAVGAECVCRRFALRGADRRAGTGGARSARPAASGTRRLSLSQPQGCSHQRRFAWSVPLEAFGLRFALNSSLSPCLLAGDSEWLRLVESPCGIVECHEWERTRRGPSVELVPALREILGTCNESVSCSCFSEIHVYRCMVHIKCQMYRLVELH